MKVTTQNYIKLIILHSLIGLIVFLFKDLSKIYSALIVLFGLYFIIKNKNRNNEVLFVCAYLVGSEIFTRMTKGFPIYEFSKYMVIVFCLIGTLYNGFSNKAFMYWLFLIFLIPGVIIATSSLSLDSNLRKNISFNLSGPICLAIASIYCYKKKISFEQINKLLLAIGLPIVTTTIYLIFYTPDIKDVITGTSSNSAASGGFGPNQVATILGLGLFVFFSRLLFFSKNKLEIIINLIIIFNISYRGLVTFSRGGMITGFLMVLLLIIFIYKFSRTNEKYKIILILFLSGIIFSAVWLYSNSQTSGLISNRYQNKDALGRQKEDLTTGRGEIANSEINYFLDNPFLGIGVSKSVENRVDDSGIKIASHNEVTRMIAEHGVLGIINLLILIFTPLILYFHNKQNIYVFCFMLFWFLTINHSAMRISAPAFIYSLSLLKVKFDVN
jgi:hypothetical protein